MPCQLAAGYFIICRLILQRKGDFMQMEDVLRSYENALCKEALASATRHIYIRAAAIELPELLLCFERLQKPLQTVDFVLFML